MTKIFLNLLLCTLISLSACKQKSEEGKHDHHDHTTEAGGNQALYDEVMNIHDDVMPKMDDIHRKKTELKEKLANNPDLPQAEKDKATATIAKLDSAGESMMAWMRRFRPIPDSLGEDKARAYLENELARVKKVRENMLKALADAEQ